MGMQLTRSANRSSSSAGSLYEADGFDLFEDSAPLGFAGRDTNLYRYVGNDPTDWTDPSGLQPPVGPLGGVDALPPPGPWDRFDALTIDERMRIALDGAIPDVQPGGRLPNWEMIVASSPPNGYTCSNYSAQMMIRGNLKYLKQNLVNNIFTMLTRMPPSLLPGIAPPTKTKLIDGANRLADAYIRAVDNFLKSHPGAKPHLDKRNKLADALGWQDEFSNPWCADWAKSITEDLLDAIIKDKKLSNIFSVQHGQYKGPKGEEHNFAVIKPRGYIPKWGTADPNILRFDPWPDLLPKSYFPTTKPFGFPTNPL